MDLWILKVQKGISTRGRKMNVPKCIFLILFLALLLAGCDLQAPMTPADRPTLESPLVPPTPPITPTAGPASTPALLPPEGSEAITKETVLHAEIQPEADEILATASPTTDNSTGDNSTSDNDPTVPPPPSLSPEPAQEACSINTSWPAHIVVYGDTLFNIAVRTGTTVESLKQANCLTSDMIFRGQPLRVPRLPPANTPTPTPTSSPTPSGTPTATNTPVTPSVTPATATPTPCNPSNDPSCDNGDIEG